jgi:hypothetical protein
LFDRIIKSILLAFCILSINFGRIAAQEVDITDTLRKIEVGKIAEANSLLQQLKQTNSNDPAIIFLDAVLTKDGNDAIKKYSLVFEKFPNSQYADASLFRVFSFYYSIGSYKKAEGLLNRLKQDYPQSAYISAADRKIPDIEEEQSQPAMEMPKSTVPQIKIVKAEEMKPTAVNFTVQAGAFINEDNAKRLSDQLSKDGYSSEVTVKEIGGSQLKVVNAGRFATEDDANKALALIEARYNLKGRVIPITAK